MLPAQLFSGAVFISSEDTDIYFEMKAVLCFNFYAFKDVFRRNGTVPQTCIVSNSFELEKTIPENLNALRDTGRKGQKSYLSIFTGSRSHGLTGDIQSLHGKSCRGERDFPLTVKLKKYGASVDRRNWAKKSKSNLISPICF